MSKKTELKPLSAAVGAALAASAFAIPAANAESNPFEITTLSSGYMVADSHKEGGCGEGKCGEGKCGEGKCGEGKDKAEGSCGEGKCGEGKCGEGKDKAEGSCGEGKCGEK